MVYFYWLVYATRLSTFCGNYVYGNKFTFQSICINAITGTLALQLSLTDFEMSKVLFGILRTLQWLTTAGTSGKTADDR